MGKSAGATSLVQNPDTLIEVPPTPTHPLDVPLTGGILFIPVDLFREEDGVGDTATGRD